MQMMNSELGLRQPVGHTYRGTFRIPDKLLKPTFPPTYIVSPPHTPINSPLSLGWRTGPIQKVSALESRVGWIPAHKEWTNERQFIGGINMCIHVVSLPSVVECQCTEWRWGMLIFAKIGYHSNVPWTITKKEVGLIMPTHMHTYPEHLVKIGPIQSGINGLQEDH